MLCLQSMQLLQELYRFKQYIKKNFPGRFMQAMICQTVLFLETLIRIKAPSLVEI